MPNPPNTVSIDQYKVTGDFPADNNLHTGIKAVMTTNFGTGVAGASFGMYGISIGNGDAGSWGVHDIVGVHGTAIKNGKHWAAGMHCDVYDSVPGGTAVGLNIEFPQTQVGTDTIGINIQPHPEARDLVGIQVQNPQAFKHALKIPNAGWAFGQVDTVMFGMRFNPTRQSLEFFRALGEPDEAKVGEIKMDFGQVRPADKW
jgi:hypothetical protein